MNEGTVSMLMSLLHLTLFFALSPLMNTLMKKWKANLQGRQGPPVFQGYYDLAKYFRKETIVSKQTSVLFLATPLIVFAAIACASMMIPGMFIQQQSQYVGDAIVFIYLLGLARFFMVSAGMEPGSGFCGMASSREVMLSCLIEPVMLLCFLIIALLAGTSNLFHARDILANNGIGIYSPAYILTLTALFISGLAEMGRVPFDNPETHYELTMIHEGMLLDYSGKPLALMFWASWTKQLLILSLLANLIFPWGVTKSLHVIPSTLALGVYGIKLLTVCLGVVLVETVVAKMRLFRVKDILGASFILAVIALVFVAQQVSKG